MFTTRVKFNGDASPIYRNGILQSELKILTKIKLSVICTHMFDYHRPSHTLLLLSAPWNR